MTAQVPVFKNPKTESGLYAQIRNKMAQQGVLIRLENVIIPGLPDCLFFFHKKTILLELKVLRNGKISMPRFQWSMAIDIREHIHPNHHWYFVYEDDGMGNEQISAYRFQQLMWITAENDEGGKTIRLDLRNTDPILVFTQSQDIWDWFNVLDDDKEGTT